MQPEDNKRDFIVSELLSELKNENDRKDKQIKSLHKVIGCVFLSALVGILFLVGLFVWYLNQYDFTSSNEYVTEQTAEGVFAVIDSNGNVIGEDLTPDQLNKLIGELDNGQSNSEKETN